MTSTGNPATTSGPTSPAGRLDPHDPRAVFGRAVALGGSVIAAVRDDQLAEPTPCTEMDVATLLAHLAVVLDRVAAIGSGQNPFAVTHLPSDTPEGGWSASWTSRAHRVQAAWADDATLALHVLLPWAEFDGAGALAHYTDEVTIHTWDLATATGQSPVWDDEVVAVAFDAIRSLLPAEGRRQGYLDVVAKLPPGVTPAGQPFADPVPIAPDAPLIDQLVAWTGRQP